MHPLQNFTKLQQRPILATSVRTGINQSTMQSTVQVKAPQNRLLTLLSRMDYERLQPHLQPVQLRYKQVLYKANKPIEFVYFLQTGVGSLVSTMHNGAASEVGTIGNEGIVGLPIVLGDRRGLPACTYKFRGKD